jgi:hypothetical protein
MEKTITTIFMVPTLKIDRNALKDNGFINGYVKDSHREVQYPDCIYLVFQPKNVDRFREFLDSEYERTKDLIDDYNYEGGYVVVVYRLNKEYEKDFKMIRQGKYSKTSKAFQALFPKVIKIMKNGLHKDEISLQYRVFNRTEDLIKFWEDRFDVEFDDDQEIWHAFEDKNEVLDLNKLKTNV